MEQASSVEGDIICGTSSGIIDDITLPRRLESIGGPIPFDVKHLRRLADGLLNEAAAIAKPVAFWQVALLEIEGDGDRISAKIGPIVLTNPVLTKNLAGLGRAFPYLATEGKELAQWAEKLPAKHKTAAFIIRYLALKEAERRLEEKLKELFGIPELGAMSPGVLPAWPLTGQKDLFKLLGPAPKQLGVTLQGESCWMSPDVSSSGLYFESQEGFHNCRLCPLERCSLRRFEREEQ
ncbi:MAG: hypothetical protein LBJ64_01420 [Deltaproteobacteria bacterium]|jgi:hypothetical protein|nr:hypothetical protein [Deltaproteobacteria bacterium]